MKKLMFVCFALLVISSLSFGQSGPGDNTGTVTVTVSVGATAVLTVGDAALTVAGIPPGATWDVIPDGEGAAWVYTAGSPVDGSAIVSEVIAIAGEPLADVEVSFALPYVIASATAGNPSIRVNYTGTSAVWVTTGGAKYYFNPVHATTITLDDAGAGSVALGGNFTVPNNAIAAEDYVGEAIVAVAYVGN